MRKGLLFAFKSRNAFAKASTDRSIYHSRFLWKLPENARSLLFVALASTTCVMLTQYGLARSLSAIQEPARNQIVRDFDKLPLSFETNRGQADRSVRFLA